MSWCHDSSDGALDTDTAAARVRLDRISGGAAHGERIDAQRRLAHAHRHALAVLAAGADAIVELQVVADHGHARQHVRTVADQGRALQRRADAAVLDGVSLARRKYELAGGDVHLAAAE